MDAIAKAPASIIPDARAVLFVALRLCPVVPIAGWLEEVDVTLARSPGFFAGKTGGARLSAVDLSQSASLTSSPSLEQRNIRILGIEGVDAAQPHGEHAAFADRRTPLPARAETNRRSLRLNQSQFRFCSKPRALWSVDL